MINLIPGPSVLFAMGRSLALGAGLARDWFASNPKRLGVVSGTGGILIVGLGVFENLRL